MNKIILFVIGIFVFLGCARVRVEAPKEPIKVDVSMRLDIYQHVVKDIDNIESIVTGTDEKSAAKDKNSFLKFMVSDAYAQESLNPDVENAALRRRQRHSELESWESKGVVGENKLGLVEIKSPENSSGQLSDLVKNENSDRMIIYESVAKKNKVTLDEVQQLYAKRLQADAPSGTPIEVVSASSGNYEWVRK